MSETVENWTKNLLWFYLPAEIYLIHFAGAFIVWVNLLLVKEWFLTQFWSANSSIPHSPFRTEITLKDLALVVLCHKYLKLLSKHFHFSFSNTVFPWLSVPMCYPSCHEVWTKHKPLPPKAQSWANPWCWRTWNLLQVYFKCNRLSKI